MSFFLYPSTFEKVPKDTLVIFWTYEFGRRIERPILDDLRRKIHAYCSTHFPFDRVLLLTHKKNKHHTEQIINFFQFEGLTYSLSLTDIQNGVLAAIFDENGALVFLDSNKNTFATSIKTRQAITKDGLRYIFENRGAIIKAQDHFHYILPSGKHSNVFIRVGNIFKIGWEINFIGFSLLQFLKANTKNIYCDTSSIITAAQSAVNLKIILSKNFTSPSINSFGSYKGVKDHHFIDPQNSLFLISTSTTWDLAEMLYNRISSDTDDNFIVTLFKPLIIFVDDDNPQKSSIGKILCDLRDVDPEPIRVYKHKCGLCENNSTAINISGDEFLPEKQKIDPIVINEKYKPKWFDTFLPMFVGTNHIQCHKKKKISGDDVRELFLDIGKLHTEIIVPKGAIVSNEVKYERAFNRYLNKKLPASLKIVIYLDDEASKIIATQIKTFFENATQSINTIQMIEYIDSPDFPGELEKMTPHSEGSILVVGSSIAQGRTILTISRDLRKFYDKGFQLCYFVAVVRTFTSNEFNRIKTNLLYSKELGTNTHTFDSLFEISIPDERYRTETPWTEELKLLSGNKDEIASNSLFLERLSILQKSSEGLVNDLFWRSPNGKNISLNPGFVFFNFDFRDRKVSQADVYFTISCILHHLRTEYKEGHQVLLAQSENHCKILDPENFYRFNDSVIQASLLRAAQSIELDYSYDKVASKSMKDLICRIVEESQDASFEFLLALAVKKVKLTTDDTRLLVSRLIEINNSTVGLFLLLIQPPSEEQLLF